MNSKKDLSTLAKDLNIDLEGCHSKDIKTKLLNPYVGEAYFQINELMKSTPDAYNPQIIFKQAPPVEDRPRIVADSARAGLAVTFGEDCISFSLVLGGES